MQVVMGASISIHANCDMNATQSVTPPNMRTHCEEEVATGEHAHLVGCLVVHLPTHKA